MPDSQFDTLVLDAVTIQWTRRVRQAKFSNENRGFRELTQLIIYI